MNLGRTLGLFLVLTLVNVQLAEAQVLNLSYDTAGCSSYTLHANVTISGAPTSYTASNIPFAPEPTSGNPVFLSDDAVSGGLPIGFNFCYYGNTYSTFYIGSNGWVSFTGGQPTTYTSAVIPSGGFSVPKNCVMGPWEDWNPGLCSGACIFYQTTGVAPNRKLIVTYNSVPMFSCTSTFGTFQIVLHETTNIIENHLIFKPNCPGWAGGTGTEGLHNINGTVADVFPGRNSTQWVTSNESVRFTPSGTVGSTINWYTSGNVFLGTGDSITVNTNTHGLNYEARITICGVTHVEPITVPPLNGANFTITTDAVEDATCYNAADGSVSITMNGGLHPFTYAWSHGPMIEDVTGLAAGPYYVTATSNDGCSLVDTFTINEPDSIMVSEAYHEDVECFGDSNASVTLSAIGGGGMYQYAIGSQGPQSSANFSGLPQGTFSFTVNDTAGCTGTLDVTIAEPTQLSVSALSQSATSCYGSSDAGISLTANGGSGSYQYSVDNISYSASNAFGGLTAGVQFFYAVDDSGCVAMDSTTLVQPDSMDISQIFNIPESCNGYDDGQVAVSVIGGTSPYNYAWSGSASTSDTATALIPGMHTVTVTDDSGCVQQASYAVDSASALTGALTATDVSCSGTPDGTSTVVANGGTGSYTYSWNDPSSTSVSSAGSLNAGTYVVTVMDGNNCVFVDSVVVSSPSSVVVTLDSIDVTCHNGNDGSVMALAIGGVGNYQYRINNGPWQSTSQFNGLTAGNYTLVVRDSNNCAITQTIDVHEPAEIDPVISGLTNASCNGFTDGSITVSATHGVSPYQYVIDNNAPQGTGFFGGLGNGNYTLYIIDGDNCIDSVNTSISHPSALNLAINPTHPLCFGDANGSIAASANGGSQPYQYSIDGTNFQSSNNFSGLVDGSYTITLMDDSGCVATTNAALIQPTQFSINVGAQPISCEGNSDGRLTISAQGGTPPHNDYSVSSDGINFINQTSGLFEGLPAGTQTIIAEDANGCIAQATVIIGQPLPDVFDVIVDSTSCYGDDYMDGSIAISASQNPPYNYSIDGGEFVPAPAVFTDLPSGVYQIVAENGGGCKDTISAFVPSPAPIILATSPEDISIDLGEQIRIQSQLISGNLEPVYRWEPHEGLSCTNCPNPMVSIFNTTEYTLTVFDGSDPDAEFPCFAEKKVLVRVGEEIPVYVPNAFTPNGDGFNDEFLIYGQDIKDATMKVFDRWGEKMYEGRALQRGWDGRFKGDLVSNGAYVYMVEVTYLNGEKYAYRGSVTVIR